MHSPPRPLTVKDQQDWKIPPCVSNWKNSKVWSGWGLGAGAGLIWFVRRGLVLGRRKHVLL